MPGGVFTPLTRVVHRILAFTEGVRTLPEVAAATLRVAIEGPLFAAVARSTTLRSLDYSRAGVSTDCARDYILPAVRVKHPFYFSTWVHTQSMMTLFTI